MLGGAGGTGSAAVQLGRVLGARVIATARGPVKGDFCRALGADHVIDYTADDVAERVKEITDGVGADVVYDAVGGEVFDAATRCIAHEGRLLAVGFASGRWGTPSSAHMVTHNYSVMGVMPSGYDRAFKCHAQEALLSHLREGGLRVPVERELPFEKLPEGLEALAAGSASGKWVLSL